MLNHPPASAAGDRILFIWLIIALGGASGSLASERDSFLKAGELNESAVKKISAGNLDGAELDLLRALEYSGQNAKIRKNLGVVYYEKGVRFYKSQKNYQEARRFLKMALDIEPENALYRKAYATALLIEADTRGRAGDMNRALELYRQASEWDGTNIHIWIQAAHYAWATHQMAEAQTYLDKARQLDPNDKNVKVMEEKMKSVSKESGLVNAGSSEHFVLAADPDYVRKVGAHKIFYDLEDAFNKVSFKLNYYPKRKITVVFYPAAQFRDHWQAPVRVAGLYDGKLRIPYFDALTSPETLRPIIMHELTHAFLDMLCERTLPRWVDEGLAQWVEGRKLPASQARILWDYSQKGKVAPLSRLDEGLAQKELVSYLKSFSIMDFLIAQFGVWTVLEWAKTPETEGDFEGVFSTRFKMNYEAADKAWSDWLRSQLQS